MTKTAAIHPFEVSDVEASNLLEASRLKRRDRESTMYQIAIITAAVLLIVSAAFL